MKEQSGNSFALSIEQAIEEIKEFQGAPFFSRTHQLSRARTASRCIS